jgi:hypothetical protein
VGELPVHQCLWNHPGYGTTGLQRSIGNRTHQPYLGAAVDQSKATPGNSLTKFPCTSKVAWPITATGATKNTEFHTISTSLKAMVQC